MCEDFQLEFSVFSLLAVFIENHEIFSSCSVSEDDSEFSCLAASYHRYVGRITEIRSRYTTTSIIHEEKKKDISTVSVVWILKEEIILIKPTFTSIFSQNTDVFLIYQTRGRVFHQDIQTANTSKFVQKPRLRLCFQQTSPCLDILMKHSSSCLIYYISTFYLNNTLYLNITV